MQGWGAVVILRAAYYSAAPFNHVAKMRCHVSSAPVLCDERRRQHGAKARKGSRQSLRVHLKVVARVHHACM
jgi:hypothetical protein